MQLNQGDVAIVTGASKGLGVHIARSLADRGVNLVLAARSAQALDEVARSLRNNSVKVLTAPTDVSRPDALNNLVSTAISHFGRIDVLINNAGAEYALRFDELTAEEIQNMIAVNLSGPILLSRFVLPHMLRNGRGHIVNIASVAGVMSSPYEEPYVATKHGLVGFTRSLRLSAQELKWPISASVICPGFMEGAGMYEAMKKNHGVTAPSTMGVTNAGKLGAAVIHAIESDAPDIILMKGAPRMIIALLALMPRAYEFITAKLDTSAVFRTVAQGHLSERKQKHG